MRQKNIKNYYQKVSILCGIIALTAMQSAQAAQVTLEKISVNNAYASSEVHTNRGPLKTLDETGLSYSGGVNVPGNWTYTGYGTYGENANWTSKSGNGNVGGQWIIFDLGGIHTSITTMNVANFDAANTQLRTRGLDQGNIYYSTDSVTVSGIEGNNYAPNFNGAGTAWTPGVALDLDMTPEDATDSSNAYTTTEHEFQSISLGNITARYIAIEVTTNHGDANYVGLNEVQFFKTVIPEPMSTAFIFMSTVLAVGLRRRCNFS